MNDAITIYNQQLPETSKAICKILANTIDADLPAATSKIWHGHPVWFLDDNPVVGYSPKKEGVELLFWSGQPFDDNKLLPTGKFKAAKFNYLLPEEVILANLNRWLQQAINIQWDYKNLVKRKGQLERLK